MSFAAGIRRSILSSSRSSTPSTPVTRRVQTPLFVSNKTSFAPAAARRTFASSTSTMGVHNLSSKADFDAAVKDDSLMILDCFATWCGPCKVIAPQVVKFSDAYPNARFYKIDVDEVPDVAQELAIRAMPTFVIFKGGEKVGEIVGANPKALEAAIQQHSA